MSKAGVAAFLLAGIAAVAPAAPGQVLKGSAPQPLERSGAAREIPAPMTARYQKTKGMLQPSVRAWVEQQGRSEGQKAAPDVAGVEAAVRARFGSCAGQTGGAPGARVNAVAVGAGASAARGTQAGACLGEADIEELAFLVMMEASQDADRDLRQIMAEVKAKNEARNAERETLRKMRVRVNELESKLIAGGFTGSKGAANAPCNIPECDSVIEVAGQLTTMTAQGKRPLRYNASGKLSAAQVQQLADKMKDDLDSMSELGEQESLRMQMAMDRMSKLMSTLSNLLKKMSDTSSGIVQNLK
jgi:hypothetical protein